MKKEYIIWFIVFILLIIGVLFDNQIAENLKEINNIFLDQFFIGVTFISNVLFILIFISVLFLYNKEKRKLVVPLWMTVILSSIIGSPKPLNFPLVTTLTFNSSAASSLVIFLDSAFASNGKL